RRLLRDDHRAALDRREVAEREQRRRAVGVHEHEHLAVEPDVGAVERPHARAGSCPRPHASTPPSTTTVVPVTYAPPSGARNPITAAISPGRPSRPSGTERSHSATRSAP